MAKKDETFGRQLKLLLDYRGMKPHALVKAGVLGNSQVSYYLTSYQEPSFSKIRKMADFFDISAGYFFDQSIPFDFITKFEADKLRHMLNDIPTDLSVPMNKLLLGFLENAAVVRASAEVKNKYK